MNNYRKITLLKTNLKNYINTNIPISKLKTEHFRN